MDRARRGAAMSRRKPLAGSASPQSTPDTSVDRHLESPASPVMGTSIHTPHTAPQSRRGSRPAQQCALTFPAPASAREAQGPKRRSRTMDGYAFADQGYADQGSPNKGGHSLRKRARVDYTFEHIDDDVLVPNSTSSSSARSKKRRSDITHHFDDFHHASNASKRRDASLGDDSPASVRRNPARRSVTETAKAYRQDDDVKDTIEVGVSFSDLEESEDPPRPGHYSHSGSAVAQSPPLAALWQPDAKDGSLPALTAAVAAINTGAVAQQDSKAVHGREAQANGQAIPEHNNAPNALTHQVPQPPGPAAISRDSDSELRTSSRLAAPSLDSTQETLETDSAEQPTEQATSQETQPSPGASKGQLGSLGPASEKELTSPAGHEPGSHHLHHDATPPAVEEKDHQRPQKMIVTTKSVPHKTPAVERRENDHVEKAHRPSSPRSTESDSMELGADNMPQKQPPTLGQPPTIIVSDAPAQPSSTSTPDPTDSASAMISDTPFAKPSPLEALVGAHLFARRLRTENLDTQERLDPCQIRQAALKNALEATLSPYVDGEHDLYPENRDSLGDDESNAEQTPEIKDYDNSNNDNGMEPMMEDNDNTANSPAVEAPSLTSDTPAHGSPALDESMEPTAVNSPTAAAAGGDDDEEPYVAASQDPPNRRRFFKYRKIRDPSLFLSVLKNFKQMPTDELYQVLSVVNEAMQDWQTEYLQENKLVEDCENAGRRRAAEEKYEAKLRDMPGKNHEEPDIFVKGYKEKQDTEATLEKRYRQAQDKIQAASYGFEWDADPAKLGCQDPKEQPPVDGIMPRRRSLRNQPRQTVKATESDEVTGKRQRKPVQHFDPAPQKPSRSATPAATQIFRVGRKRRNTNFAEAEEQKPRHNAASNKKAEETPEPEETPSRGKKQRRGAAARANFVEGMSPAPPSPSEQKNGESPTAGAGRRRSKKVSRLAAVTASEQTADEEARADEPKRKRHLLTLKIPKVKNLSEPSSAITDNGDSRPSTASSHSSSHTAESTYSFRPVRQKRFRDEPDDGDEAAEQRPTKKRGNKRAAPPLQGDAGKGAIVGEVGKTASSAPEAPAAPTQRKISKIKLVSKTAGSRNNSAPTSQPVAAAGEGDERPKDYKSMTKSEKMSASMKSRWANGNMAGAVEKRKATLAAKKAAQAAADQKLGAVAPKPKIKTIKKGATAQGQQQQQPQPQPPQQQQQQQQQTELLQQGLPGTAYQFTTN